MSFGGFHDTHHALIHRFIARPVLPFLDTPRSRCDLSLHCLVLDGVYRRTGGEPVFQELRAPSRDELAGLLDKIIARLMKMLTRQGYLLKEQGVTYLADRDADNPLASLQAAACTYRIALGPRAGQKVLSLRTVPGRDEKATAARAPPRSPARPRALFQAA